LSGDLQENIVARPNTPESSKTPSGPTLGLLTLGGLLVAGGAYLARRFVVAPSPSGAEHAAPDLALDRPRPGPDDRAPDAFRPDPTAPVPESEREALRPATGPAPTLVAGTSIAAQD
jgi:hypothetical protein